MDAVIAMGRRLSLRLVAEGVENAEQLKFLRSRGCDFGRGIFWVDRCLPGSSSACFRLRAVTECTGRRKPGGWHAPGPQRKRAELLVT